MATFPRPLAPRSFARFCGALALALAVVGAAACSEEEEDDCVDCGVSCPDPTCSEGEVEVTVNGLFQASGDGPARPLDVRVTFDEHEAAFVFESDPSSSSRRPSGPCRAAAGGSEVPELCRVEPDGSLRVKALSVTPAVYADTTHAVGVTVRDASGAEVFSAVRDVTLDDRWAPGCRPIVDPGYCGAGTLRFDFGRDDP